MGKTKKDSPKFKKEKKIEKFNKEHRREESKILPRYLIDEYDDDDLLDDIDDLLIKND